MLKKTLYLLFLLIISFSAFSMDLSVEYYLKNIKKEDIMLQIDPTDTVGDVKQKIFKIKQSEKFKVSNQIISYRPFYKNKRQDYVRPDDEEDLFELTGKDCPSDRAYFSDECKFNEPLRLELKK